MKGEMMKRDGMKINWPTHHFTVRTRESTYHLWSNNVKWQQPTSTFKTLTSGIPYQQYLVPWQHSTHKAVAPIN